MSLPTPEAQHDVPLPPVDTVEPLGVPQTDPVSFLFAGDNGIVVPPPAPRMKDYDTFTEGTAEGSFNSIPAAETNELGEPIYPISARALAALPLNDAAVSIEQWRQGVQDFVAAQPAVVAAAPVLVLRDRAQLPTTPIIDLACESEANTTPTQKRPRPRSNSPDDARRLRRAPCPSPRLRPRAHSFLSVSSGMLNSFIWVDRVPRPRPPSRANSAPPD